MAGKLNPIRGYTMIEIMAVLVVVGIVMSLAYPKFTSFIRMMELRSTVANVRRQLMVAKVKAVSNPQIHCGVYFNLRSSPPSALVFLDTDSNSYAYSPTGDKRYATPYQLPKGMALSIIPDTQETIVFRGDGSAHTNAKVVVTTSLNKKTTRSDTVDVLANTGRIKVLR
jgi:prepilin-type N-terminal cleavage/methylation domain-containing protein